jgi:shikimate dehydrogenase
LGVREVRIVGRHRHKLEAFQHSWVNSPVPVLATHTWEELPQLLPQSSLLVNTTPVGMYPNVDEMPVSAAEMAALPAGAIVYDLIYTPNPTQFLKAARSTGAIAIDGLEMLVGQGAAALQIWLQQPVPVSVMRQSLRQHLGLPT